MVDPKATGPSKRHVWEYFRHSAGGAVERCKRCGSFFVEKADTRGPVYCHPKPEWLREHPEDDKEER